MYNIYRNTKHDNTERYAVYAEFTGNEDAKKKPILPYPERNELPHTTYSTINTMKVNT